MPDRGSLFSPFPRDQAQDCYGEKAYEACHYPNDERQCSLVSIRGERRDLIACLLIPVRALGVDEQPVSIHPVRRAGHKRHEVAARFHGEAFHFPRFDDFGTDDLVGIGFTQCM